MSAASTTSLGTSIFSADPIGWVAEGGADFLATLAEITVGTTSIEERMKYLDDRIERNCDATFKETLVDWRRNVCDYNLGERLLWNMYVTLGQETTADGMRALSLALREGQVSE